MKSTKRILSAILSVVMILGCLTVGFTAQASGADLQEEINAAIKAGIDVDWEGGNVTLADTLVINGDVDVDFNGAVITGPAGKVAIRVDGGNVTLYDGVVLADQGSYSGEMAFVKALMSYKPAISINDGDVELNCITAVGSLLRIPNSSTIEVPIGNGINANGGDVTLDNVIAIGMKALDNTKADVTVKDAILAGIYKAVNIYKAVDFGANYEQYETVELLEGFLNDGVTLSANEKKYIASATNSQGDFSALSVIVNVAKPAFAGLSEPKTEFVNGNLNVEAYTEYYTESGVSNRYSYAYTPDYAVIGDDKQVFANPGYGSSYYATFEGLDADAEYDVTVNYDLSIKLGKKQKEIVEDAFKTLAHYIDKAPELLYRFVEDFDNLYEKAESLVAMLYNAYFSTEEVVQDQISNIKVMKDVMGLIYALEGQEFNGSATVDGKEEILNNGLVATYASMSGSYLKYDYSVVEAAAKSFVDSAKASMVKNYGAIFDTNDDGVADSVFAYFNNETFEKAASFNESGFAKGQPGYGSGVGLLDEFNKYYNKIMELVYGGSTTEFNDLGAAAYYVGKNWQDILELVENAVVVLNKAHAIVNGDELGELLGAVNMGNVGSVQSIVNAFNKVYKYANIIMGRVDEVKATTFFKTFIEKPETAAKYCKTYTEKVWKIANNPEVYFDVQFTGEDENYVAIDLLDKDLNKTFTASTAVKPVNVKVTVSGMGSAQLNNLDAASSYNEWFAYGKDITVAPVETYEGAAFKYMVVKSNGNQTVVDGGVFTAKAATNLEIVLVFESTVQETAKTEVVFMTDKALNYKYIDMISLNSDSIADEWSDYANDEDIRAPKFEGLTFNGWTVKKDGSAADTDITNLADDVAAENSDFVIVYAAYTYKEQVEVDPQKEVIEMTNYEVIDGKGYFEVNIQLKGAKAIEAGIILTMTESYATEGAMKINLSGTPGVIFARTSKVTDGYVNQNVQYTAGVNASGTVYARGYVVYENGTAEYTDIVSLDIIK
ncbi:MAG: hypothetical protein IJE14_12035 [Clostridia bacterium]|nr:hypothetical protein [Clostridia bacterium]